MSGGDGGVAAILQPTSPAGNALVDPVYSDHPNRAGRSGRRASGVQDQGLKRSRLDVAMSLVQPLSIIVGGCWIAFLYFTFQEKSDRASLVEKQLSIQQAQIVLKTQEQSNKLDVDLKNITLEQARIAVTTQQNEKALKRTQLETEVELKKQEVLLNRLKERQQEHDVQYSTNYRSSYEMKLKAAKVGIFDNEKNDYIVTLHFRLKNESTVSYELSYLAVEYYGAVPKLNLGRARGDISLAPIGTPPSLVNSGAEMGALDWFSLGAPRASAWAAAAGDMGGWNRLINPSVTLNGPNTGIVVPGGTTEFDYEYIVRARPGDYLGFVVDWIINRAKGADDVNYLNQTIRLSDDKTGGEAGR